MSIIVTMRFLLCFQSNGNVLRTKRSSSDSMTFSGIKSSPFDGLVWRLTVALAHCFHILGGVKPVAHLIHEFMLEIRHRWVGGIFN